MYLECIGDDAMDESFSERSKELDQKISESSQTIKKAIEKVRTIREECRKTTTIIGALNGKFKTSNPCTT